MSVVNVNVVEVQTESVKPSTENLPAIGQENPAQDGAPEVKAEPGSAWHISMPDADWDRAVAERFPWYLELPEDKRAAARDMVKEAYQQDNTITPVLAMDNRKDWTGGLEAWIKARELAANKEAIERDEKEYATLFGKITHLSEAVASQQQRLATYFYFAMFAKMAHNELREVPIPRAHAIEAMQIRLSDYYTGDRVREFIQQGAAMHLLYFTSVSHPVINRNGNCVPNTTGKNALAWTILQALAPLVERDTKEKREVWRKLPGVEDKIATLVKAVIAEKTPRETVRLEVQRIVTSHAELLLAKEPANKTLQSRVAKERVKLQEMQNRADEIKKEKEVKEKKTETTSTGAVVTVSGPGAANHSTINPEPLPQAPANNDGPPNVPHNPPVNVPTQQSPVSQPAPIEDSPAAHGKHLADYLRNVRGEIRYEAIIKFLEHVKDDTIYAEGFRSACTKVILAAAAARDALRKTAK